jgi:hypothetical protein
MTPAWDAAWHTRSPIYRPLLEAVHRLGTSREDWPDLGDYNRLLQSAPFPVHTHSGKPVRCVPQGDDHYEQRAYLTGEVQTRSNNWHDFFNALVWRVFPRTKAAINLLHYRTSQEKSQPAVGRGTARDVLTLFDESGVVIVCAQAELGELLKQHQWKSLFWQHRNEVAGSMQFFVFGHSLYEKALQPYIGLAGKALILPVSTDFLALPLARQLAETDAMMTEHFLRPDSLHATSSLSPLPLLGVPGWWPDNNNETFYENTRHFRPISTSKNCG